MFLTLLSGAGPGGITGNLAATETGADTASAEGLVKVQGTLAATETGADTFSASGTAAVSITGTLAATEAGPDAMAAEGIVKVQGALAATEGAGDTFAATGDTVFYTITGTQALRLMHIHMLHGLVAGSPLAVSPTARTAGAVAQTVAEAGGIVTLTTTAVPTVMVGTPGALIDELAALHGLTAPLAVTATTRSAGNISQTITSAGDTTTVSRA